MKPLRSPLRAETHRMEALQEIARIADQGYMTMHDYQQAMTRICVHAYEAMEYAAPRQRDQTR